jgi:hypothetical protein
MKLFSTLKFSSREFTIYTDQIVSLEDIEHEIRRIPCYPKGDVWIVVVTCH